MKVERQGNPIILKDRECIICGKKFDVQLEKDGKIPNKYWFNKTIIKELTGKDGEYWNCDECSEFKDDIVMREKMKEWMTRYWGERCPDYEESCSLCRAWKCFDYLFNDIE